MPQVWYPQTWVRLYARVEDYVNAPPPPLPPQTPPQTDPVLMGKSNPSLAGDFFQIGQAVVPNDAKLTLNSYRMADEVTVTIDADDIPLDPRVLRMVAIEVFMGALNPDDYAESLGTLYSAGEVVLLPEVEDGRSNLVFRGFADDMSWSLSEDQQLTITARDITSILLDAEAPQSIWRGSDKTTPLDVAIIQAIDGDPAATPNPQVNRPQSNVVSLRAKVQRAQRRIASINAKAAALQARAATNPSQAANIANKVALLQSDVVLLTSRSQRDAQQLAALTAQTDPPKHPGLPAMRGVRVVNDTGAPLPTLGEIHGASWFDSKGKTKRSRVAGAKERIGYWDAITDLVVAAGFICYVRTPVQAANSGDTPPAEIVISTPRTYYDTADGDVREFRYGENVTQVSITRSFQGRNIPTGVLVSAVASETGETLTGAYPPIDTRGKPVAVNRPALQEFGSQDRAEYTRILLDQIPGDNAQATLDRVAESVYEQLSRGEIEISLSTKRLAALPGGGFPVADMLQLRAGDTIRIALLPASPDGDPGQPQVTTAGSYFALATTAQVDFLVRRGVPPAIAAAVVSAYEDDRLQREFRVKEVAVNWSIDSGFDFDVQAHNYLDARQPVRGVPGA